MGSSRARRVINVSGLSHAGQPIPLACVVRGVLVSGNLSGRSPVTGEPPVQFADEIRQLFANVETMLAAAGGHSDDIVRMTFSLADRDQRDALNHEWQSVFPSPQDRPARHVKVHDLPPGLRIQADVMAVLDDQIDAGNS